MKQFSIKPIRLFRFKSIFTTILISMISLGIALCIIFSLFFTNTIIGKTTEHQMQTDRAYLNTMVGNTDYLIKSLHQSLTQLSYSNSIFTLALSNQLNTNTVNYAMTDIAQAADNNSLIESVLLYVPKIDRIITSSYTAYTFNDFPNRQLISNHEKGLSRSVTIEDTLKKSSLFFFDGKLIVSRDFPLNGDKRLATLYYIINTQELYRRMASKPTGNSKVLVYDAYNTPVFSKEMIYPKNITSDIIPELETSAKQPLNIGQSAIFNHSSSITGWRFLYIVDESALRPATGSIFAVLFPIILLILVVASVVSLLIASILYRPFQRLLNAIESKNLAPDALRSSKNELDYLNYAFSEIAGHQSELQTMMRKVSHDVMSRLFLDLLSGSQISHSNVKEILTSIQSPFQANASYVACVLHCTSDVLLTESQRLVILSELKDIMNAFNKKCDALSHVLVVDSQTFTIILSFYENSNIMKIKKELSSLELSFNALSKIQGLTILFGAGHLYHSILDIGFSYKEAFAALSQHDEFKELELADSVIPPDADLNSRAQQVLSLVLSNNTDGAKTLSERIINDIFSSAADISSKINSCEIFITALVNKIVKLEYIDLSSIPNELLMFSQNQQNSNDATDLSNAAKESCSRIIAELAKMLKKQQNRFLVAAQEYIGKHYCDCSLSLNLIAEAIGANPSYLSRLFKDNLGVYFTDYINNYRVNSSLRLLEADDKSIKDIALNSGFNSVQNYIRVFKKHIGKTPGQHRESLEKSSNIIN